MAKREYPRNDNEYPEVMSKMDPLIIRVDPLVMVVGSTTYTAKVKIGYKFNGFLVHVSGVGIPVYKEVVDITGYNTGKTTTGEGSDAYKYVQDKARDWMDTLEKSMLDDNKEKNIVDLLRELKYQMHFDASGHKYPAIVPGTDEYDARMEVCTDVPTYITDIYQLLADMNAKLNNLMLVIASDGTGDSASHKNELITSVTVKYGEEGNPHGFTVENSYSGEPVKGLNTRIEELNASIGTGKDEGQTKESLQSRITKLQESIGDPSNGTVIGKLDTIGDNVTTVASDIVALSTQSSTNATTISNAITNGLNQLVAKMNDMNGRIGTPSDTEANDTLFGYINKTKSAPIISMDNDHVEYLNYWGQDLYKGNNDGTSYEYLIGAMKTFFTKNNTCTAKKLDAAMVNGHILHWYNTTSGDRGFEQRSSGPEWGIKIHDRA